jgi:hypothetical protein
VETSRPIEHGHGRVGSFLHEQRVRLVLGIALVEGILVIADAVPWWTVLILALVAFPFYAVVGRGHTNSVVRDGSWVAAVSQLVVVLVPVVAAVVTTLAVVALVLVALVAIALLLLDRR